MPELPEVETIRRQLAPVITGATVTSGWAHPSAKFAEAPAAVGHTIRAVGRRGKYLIVSLDRDVELIVHLGMTGALSVVDSPGDEYVRAWWRLDDDGRLEFRDVRRFGRIAVTPAGEYDRLPTLAALGPEPLGDEFTADHLWRSLRTSRRAVKTQLLGQRVVAGVGNIYADEALWRARIHPQATRLSPERATRLRGALCDVLAAGIRHGGTTLRDYVDAEGSAGSHQRHLDCYGRAEMPCHRCETGLRRVTLDGRSATYCPACQRI